MKVPLFLFLPQIRQKDESFSAQIFFYGTYSRLTKKGTLHSVLSGRRLLLPCRRKGSWFFCPLPESYSSPAEIYCPSTLQALFPYQGTVNLSSTMNQSLKLRVAVWWMASGDRIFTPILRSIVPRGAQFWRVFWAFLVYVNTKFDSYSEVVGSDDVIETRWIPLLCKLNLHRKRKVTLLSQSIIVGSNDWKEWECLLSSRIFPIRGAVIEEQTLISFPDKLNLLTFSFI